MHGNLRAPGFLPRLLGAAPCQAAAREPASGKIPAAEEKGPAGVSLFELVVALSVVALLSLPGIRHLQDWIPAARVERAAREVVALLEWCRWQAVTDGCVYRVTVDSDGERFLVFAEPEIWTEDDPWLLVRAINLRERFPGVVLGSAPTTYRTSGCKLVDPSGVHLQDGRVHFLPHGVSDRSGSVYLIPEPDLPGRRDRTVAVSVLLSTGRLQLWRYDPLLTTSCAAAGGWKPIY